MKCLRLCSLVPLPEKKFQIPFTIKEPERKKKDFRPEPFPSGREGDGPGL